MNNTPTVERNKVITMQYSLTNAEGVVLRDADSKPVSYLHGAGTIPARLEQALAAVEGDGLDLHDLLALADHEVVRAQAEDDPISLVGDDDVEQDLSHRELLGKDLVDRLVLGLRRCAGRGRKKRKKQRLAEEWPHGTHPTPGSGGSARARRTEQPPAA